MRSDFERFLSITDSGEPDIYDQLEPEEAENHYREASKKALSFIFSLIEFLGSYGNARQLELRFWAVASSLSHPCCESLNDSELATMLEKTRAAFSKHLVDFERRNGLTPALSQKSVIARQSYAKSHGAGDKTRLLEIGEALVHLAKAVGLLAKLGESTELSQWPETERDVLLQRIERLNALVA
jgi:hypothetical protein